MTDALSIVVMNEQPKNELMKTVGLGKRQGFAHEAGQMLAQSIEPALDMVSFTASFADRLMPVSGKHALISFPEIAKRVAARVGQGNAPPEVQATGFTAVADEVGDNLPRAAAQGHPNPPLMSFFEHKRPHGAQWRLLPAEYGNWKWLQALCPLV